MVGKLETGALLYADAYPSITKARGRELDCVECPRRQKARVALPALVEDDSEEAFEPEHKSYVPVELRRQKSTSPRRERLRRELVLPSLSEDEEP